MTRKWVLALFRGGLYILWLEEERKGKKRYKMSEGGIAQQHKLEERDIYCNFNSRGGGKRSHNPERKEGMRPVHMWQGPFAPPGKREKP